MEIGIKSGQVWVVYGGLLLFGVLYAQLRNWLARRGYLEGYTALLVIGGVLITLLINTLLYHQDPLTDLLLELGGFAASGTPMVINDWLDYAKARERQRLSVMQEVQETVRDQTQTPTE